MPGVPPFFQNGWRPLAKNSFLLFFKELWFLWFYLGGTPEKKWGHLMMLCQEHHKMSLPMPLPAYRSIDYIVYQIPLQILSVSIHPTPH